MASGETTAVIGPLLWLLGKLIVLLSTLIGWVLLPLTWLRDQIQAFGRPVWADLVATAVIVSAVLFWLGGGMRAGWRPLVTCLAIFAGIGIVIAVMGLDRGGLAGRRHAAVGRPAGDAGGVGHRHRRVDAGRHCARARPALDDSADPDFLDRLHRVLARGSADHGAVLRNLHAAAVRSGRLHHRRIDARPDRHRAVYRRLPGRNHPRRPAGDPARAGRGGERARPVLGQDHGADRDAAGVAPRHPRPRQQLHRLFKDTSLVSIVALFDLLGQLRASFSDPVWATPTTLFTGFAFTGIIYFVFCFGMSRYSLFVENRLNAHRRN